MRRTLYTLLLVICATTFVLASTDLPRINMASSPEMMNPAYPSRNIASLKVKDIQKLLGRKLSFKEKLALFVLKARGRHQARSSDEAGKTALIIAISSLGLFLLAFLVSPAIIGAFIGALIAIVLGSVTKRKNPSDSKAYAAVLIGWITLGAVVLLALIGLIAWVSFWNSI